MAPLDPSSIQSSVRWTGDSIEIIDQTQLPESLHILELRSVEETIDAIHRLAVRGAPAIGACGALGMVMGLDEHAPSDRTAALRVLEGLTEQIGNARPTAVNLSWAVKRVSDAAAAGRDPVDIRRLALREAQAIIDEDREACRLIGEFGSTELAGRNRIMTHCNTGRLATAGWGTALGVIYAKAAAGDPVAVMATETRPLLQGARLTTWELRDAGIDVTLMPDSAAAAALASKLVDAVIVGADRIAANGDTANKIGTLSHAVNAHAAGVPFYVAAPLSTFDRSIGSGDEIEIELRPPDEVRRIGDTATAPPDVKVWNPAFDVTPHRYIAAIITEFGVLHPPYTESIAAAFDQEGKAT